MVNGVLLTMPRMTEENESLLPAPFPFDSAGPEENAPLPSRSGRVNWP